MADKAQWRSVTGSAATRRMPVFDVADNAAHLRLLFANVGLFSLPRRVMVMTKSRRDRGPHTYVATSSLLVCCGVVLVFNGAERMSGGVVCAAAAGTHTQAPVCAHKVDVNICVNGDGDDENCYAPAMRQGISQTKIFGLDPTPVTAHWPVEVET